MSAAGCCLRRAAGTKPMCARWAGARSRSKSHCSFRSSSRRRFRSACHGKAVLRHPIEIAGRTFSISCVSTGTTHTAIFDDADVEERVFQEVSPLLEHHELFPERTSVLWCRAEGRERIHMRIWERGAGETFSCGSGVAAATAIGRTLGLTGRSNRGDHARRPDGRRMARRRPGADRRPRAHRVYRRDSR